MVNAAPRDLALRSGANRAPRGHRAQPRRRRAQRGLTYIALLLGTAITSAAVGAGGALWSQLQRRERETQLLWAGDQIRKAIVAYSRLGADPVNRFPRELQDLLLDPRGSAPRRYLRQVYEDPMTRSTEWGLIRNAQGRIVGVHSRAGGKPLKTGRFAPAYSNFEVAASYADWRFTAMPEPRPTGPPGAAPAASAPLATEAAPRALEPSAPAPKLPGEHPSAPRPAEPASAPEPTPEGEAPAPPDDDGPDPPLS
jgi:type II secretory pathway pseudopilin PulG